MQCGGYWHALPAGTENKWKDEGAESGAQRAKSKKNPKSYKNIRFGILCPEQESNLHDLNRSPGPQPGASTNSAIWALIFSNS